MVIGYWRHKCAPSQRPNASPDMRESVLRRKLTGKGGSECSGCGPEFTSRTPSGWPGFRASCRLDESASAAGGGRRRRPQVSSDRVIPSRAGPERPPTPGLAARRVSWMSGQAKPTRSGDEPRYVTLLVVRRGRGTSWRSGYPVVRAPRRARSRVTRGVGRQLGEAVSAGCGVARGGSFDASVVTSITWGWSPPPPCLSLS